jgi:uncharacterized protein YqeY
MKIYERIKVDLLKARKMREKTTIAVLSSALTAIDNAGAVKLKSAKDSVIGESVEVPRKDLSEKQVQNILKNEIEERRSALDVYKHLDKQEKVKCLCKELQILDQYL